jgi:hypothetical protein
VVITCIIATKWLSKKKFYSANIISSAELKGLWLIRNNMMFNAQVRLDVKLVLRKIRRLTMDSKVVCDAEKVEELARWNTFLEKKIRDPLQITNG